LRSHKAGATDPAERARLRAELDGLIAHLYGLTEEEFAYILTTFPLVPQAVKDAALEAYRKFAPAAVDAEIGALLAQGEGPRVEFKSSARWDLRENKKNGELEKVIVKTVAGFLNSDGGTLLIGVGDDATVIGLQHDYQTVHKKSRDGYELFLHDLLLNAIGKDLTPQLAITFHSLDGKDLCRVVIQPSPHPVFIKEGQFEHLYIRPGNSTRLLTTKEAIEYCKTRWK
jgi:predicted HTH transcriptional regulator